MEIDTRANDQGDKDARQQEKWIQYGWNAIEYVKKYLHFSCVFPGLNHDQSDEMEKIVNQARNRILCAEESMYELYSIPHYFSFIQFKREVRGTKRHKAGNCDEAATLAINYLRKHNIPAELMEFTNGDHVFVVIGRQPNEELDDPTKWKSAAICDPTTQDCFAAQLASQQLKYYVYDYENADNVNLYYNYTNEEMSTQESVKIRSTNDPNYQKTLVVEAQYKIQIIGMTIDKLPQQLFDTANVINQLQLLSEKIYNFHTENPCVTDTDAERAMNRFVKQGLRCALTIPFVKQDFLINKLIEAVLLAQSFFPDDEEKNNLRKSIMDDNGGMHAKEIINLANNILKPK